jgi:hypothetical protein
MGFYGIGAFRTVATIAEATYSQLDLCGPHAVEIAGTP